MSHILHSQAGDTIVEVLIAIVVVGSVLVGAFAISNVSLRQVQMAQERSEAQKIAESSVENLGTMVNGDGSVPGDPGLLTRTTPFCKKSGAITAVVDTDPDCKTGTASRYHTSIVATGNNGFETTVSWEGLDSTLQKVVIDYRINYVP
jgi:Tfp pilus assembly protein PilV